MADSSRKRNKIFSKRVYQTDQDIYKKLMDEICSYPSESNYLEKRKIIINDEAGRLIGHDVILNEEENALNSILMKHKREEYERGMKSGDFFTAVNFMQNKKKMDKSRVFQIIKKMPKGAVLHVHDVSIVSLDWLVSDVTYRKNCYIGIPDNGSEILFKFAENAPNSEERKKFTENLGLGGMFHVSGFTWQLVEDLRNMSENVAEFDEWLKSHMSLTLRNTGEDSTNQNAIWVKFTSCLKTVHGLIKYEPVFTDYLYRAMLEARDDNVQYVEVRASLQGVYTLDGTVRDQEYALRLYREATKRFVRDYPDFSGAKIIHEGHRHVSREVILESVKESIRLHQSYPDFHLGYDLVGQEDAGHSLLYYISELLYPSLQAGDALPYYFHAGETDWQGTATDDDLIDAVLLGTRRIGHGFALPKHPNVLDIVKKKKVPTATLR